MKEKKEKGSLSIFSALILLLVASLLFTFLESARMYGLRAKSHRNTMLCAESALAEYQIELLENYDIKKLKDTDFDERCKEEIIKAKQILDENGNLRKYQGSCKNENGQTYATGSYGIFNVLKKIVSIYGLPIRRVPK